MNKKLIRKMQTASGGGLVYDDGKNIERTNYNNWSKLSFTDKMKRRFNIAKHLFNESSNPIVNSVGAIFGEYDPENPDLNTGEAPSPGWGKQGVTGLHKMMAKLPEAKLELMAPLAGRSRAAATLKMEDIVKAQLHRDEVYKRWASLYKLLYDPTPTTFRTKPARVRRLETDISKTNGRTLAGGKGHAGGSYNHKSHTINVTTSKTVSAKNLEDIGFHEGIHSYGLGESPSYLWKTRYLNFPEGTNPYSLDPREIATHGIQQGQNLGIKVGQSYPGKEAMIKMIENRPDGVGFGGIPYTLYNNAKTNADYRRLWSLLNGTFKQGGKMNIVKLFKEGGQIRKMLTASGGPLQLTPEELKYLKWSKMTPELKKEYRNNRINAELQRGPNLKHFWEAFQTYIGNRDPKNPNLNVGVINVAGTPMSSLSAVSTASRAMGGPKNIFSLNKLWRMVNKRIGRSLDSEEFSDLISNSSINNIRNAAIESDNNFPIIRITELEANDFINSLRPGLKQGGKMNILEFLKKGSEIHIKEKNKGSFTRWCGGNVTEECIRRGKNSPDPKIRKKATFAANARHFKHKEGGLLKFEDGGKNGAPSTKFLSKQWFKNTGDNIGSFLKSDTGKGLLDIGLNILSGYTDYKKASNLLDSLIEQNKASLEKSYLDIMLEALLNKILRQYQLKLRWQLAYLNGETLDNYSDIVAQHVGWDLYSSALLNAEQLKRLQEALMDLQAKLAKSNALGNLFGSVVLSGLGVLGNVLGKRGTSSIPTTSTSTTATNNTLFSSPLNDSTKFWSIK